ncbi:MAG: GNAT family N-acetyltransferase [Lachnospiraceae bacterium]
MNIIFDEASKDDIAELIRLRIAYMADDFGGVSDHEKECMEKQLPDYFNRKLGEELIAFVAKDNDQIVSVAYLHIIEMPANSILLNGLYGEVLNVYTEPEYRGKGLCTRLIKNLIVYGKKRGLGRVDLSATKDGYPIYKKLGFVDKEQRYTDMRYHYCDKGTLLVTKAPSPTQPLYIIVE